MDYQGEGTFSQVFACARKLEEYKIPFHVLCVLNARTASRIGAIYRFFGRKGFLRQQYIPCLDPVGEKRGKEEWSLTPRMYGEALKELFDLWFQDQMEGQPVYIRQFENYVGMLTGAQPEACSMYGRCSMQNVIESDGSVYPCDFYAMDPCLMGNIRDPEADFERFLEQAAAVREQGDSSPVRTSGTQDVQSVAGIPCAAAAAGEIAMRKRGILRTITVRLIRTSLPTVSADWNIWLPAARRFNFPRRGPAGSGWGSSHTSSGTPG